MNRGARTLAAFLVVAALSGCGSSGDDSADAVETEAVETVQATTSAPCAIVGLEYLPSDDPECVEPAVELAWMESPKLSLVDESGYSFDVVARINEPVVEADTLNAPPGETILRFTFSGEIDVTNTTSARNADVPNFYVKTAWLSNSSICHEGVSGSYINENLSVGGMPFCELINALQTSGLGQHRLQLGPGESATLPFGGGNSRTVRETSAESATAELMDPPLWELAAEGFEGPRECLVESGGVWAVWTSKDVGCDVASGHAD